MTTPPIGMDLYRKHFEYLDRLRESGKTNMFAGASYLAQEFSMSIREARFILGSWIKNFSDD